MADAVSQWYYSVDGSRTGPVTSDELRELVAIGKLGSDDLVWKEGTAEWVSAAKVKGLIPRSVQSGPPPLPVGGPPPLPPDGPADGSPTPVPALIAGLHRQRFGIVAAAGAGMLATFLPWAHAPIIGSVSGIPGDGWITLALFIPAMVLALRGDTTQVLADSHRLGAVIPAGIAALIGLSKLPKFHSYQNFIGRDNQSIRLGLQPGIGLYLLIIAGIALVVVAWMLARPSITKSV